MSMSPNPIFPANREELRAFASVLDISCADTKSSYDKMKARRYAPRVSDIAGAPYRSCTIDSYSSIRTGECKTLFSDLMACNRKHETQYAIKCKSIRDALTECAATTKVGELGKAYSS